MPGDAYLLFEVEYDREMNDIRLNNWAGLGPGNNESDGKRKIRG